MGVHERPCLLQPGWDSGWVVTCPPDDWILTITGEDIWQSDLPVLQLPFGRDVIFSINSRMAGPAVMSCVDMHSEFVFARLRWSSRSWMRPLSQVEVIVAPNVPLTDSIVAVVMFASVDYLPQFFPRADVTVAG
jgi:hypothetical protein